MSCKWFSLVDPYGRALASPDVVRVATHDVAAFQDAIVADWHDKIGGSELRVYESDSTFTSGSLPLAVDTDIRGMGTSEANALFVVAIPQPPSTNTDVVWFGEHTPWDGVDPRDPHTLPRTALVKNLLDQLDKLRVVLVVGPRQTGKSTLAALVCRALKQHRLQQPNRPGVVMARCSMLMAGATDSIDDVLGQQCDGFKWAQLESMACDEGREVYVVVDEAQLLFASPTAAQCLQNVSAAGRLHVLLLASCTPEPSHAVQIPAHQTLGIYDLHFSQDEINTYIRNCFVAYDALDTDLSKTSFGELWFARTGGHVGLCDATARALNEVRWSRVRRGLARLAVPDWFWLLRTGWLRDSSETGLLDSVRATPAVQVMNGLGKDDQACLERLCWGANTPADAETLTRLERQGVLARVPEGQYEGQYDFASPVLGNLYREKLMSRVPRLDGSVGNSRGWET